MEKIVTYDNLHYFTYSNDKSCAKPIRGIVVLFCGLGVDPMETTDVIEDAGYAEEGIIYLVPYQNPWAWMNKQTVAFTDELLDVLFEKYQLPDDLPIVSTGLSMGGLESLVYMVYAKRTPVACVPNCPVCDLVFHYTERIDLPRTLYNTFGNYDCTLKEAMEMTSPMHLVDKMPESAEYHIFHCEEDLAVNKQLHSDKFVELMRKNHNVSYYSVPGMGHCELTPQMHKLFHSCIRDSIHKYYADN